MQYPSLTVPYRLILFGSYFIALLLLGGWSFGGYAVTPLHTIALPATPDLLVSSVTLSPTQPAAGTTGAIIMVIKNQGTVTATTGFHTYLYVDSATFPTATTATTSELFFDLPLAPNGVYTWTRTGHTFTSNSPKLYVWVDPPWENRVVEEDEQNNLLVQPAARIISVEPAQAAAGVQVTVTVSATNSHFVDGMTSADFGPGITATNVHVLNATHAQVMLTVASEATSGPRLVRLQTGAERALGANLFTVQSTPPALTAIRPNHGLPGAALLVTLQATRTHFFTGATTVDFGPAIAVQAVTVTTPTQLNIQMQIQSAAAPGARAVTVTTIYSGHSEIVPQRNGFTVDAVDQQGATLAVVPSPTTLLVNRMRTLDLVVTPGQAPVNGVQLHGKVDPAYLELTNLISHTTGLAQVMEAPHFDPDSGEFFYAAGGLTHTNSAPFVVLSLVVKAKHATPPSGAAITFLKSFPATDITGANGSILQRAQDGVVYVTTDATSAVIQGQIDLQGRPAKPHRAWSIPVTLSLTDLDNSELPALRKRVTTDEQGRFTLAGLPIGRYYLRVKGDHTLGSAIATVELGPGDNRLYLGTLLEGDVEHERSDNRVTTIDFGLLSGALNQCASDSGYIAYADLDETDDCVTARDAALLVANFNVTGDRVYATPDKVPAPIATGAQATARLTFTPPGQDPSQPLTMTSELYTVQTLPLYIDPGDGEAVLAVTGYYTFDATSLEVMALDLSDNPATFLLQSQVDNYHGTVRFVLVMAPDQPITKTRQLAAFKVRLKQATSASQLMPVLTGATGVELAGAHGSRLATATGVTLVSTMPPQGAMENANYLPIIQK